MHKWLKKLWSKIVYYFEHLDEEVQPNVRYFDEAVNGRQVKQKNNISNCIVSGDLIGGRSMNNGVSISGNSITVNGKTFNNIKGNNVSIVNGTVKVDGKIITEGLEGEVTVKWEGDVANVETHNLEVTGSVTGSVTSHNTEVEGDVGGNVVGHNIDIDGKVVGSVTGHNVSHA